MFFLYTISCILILDNGWCVTQSFPYSNKYNMENTVYIDRKYHNNWCHQFFWTIAVANKCSKFNPRVFQGPFIEYVFWGSFGDSLENASSFFMAQTLQLYSCQPESATPHFEVDQAIRKCWWAGYSRRRTVSCS